MQECLSCLHNILTRCTDLPLYLFCVINANFDHETHLFQVAVNDCTVWYNSNTLCDQSTNRTMKFRAVNVNELNEFLQSRLYSTKDTVFLLLVTVQIVSAGVCFLAVFARKFDLAMLLGHVTGNTLQIQRSGTLQPTTPNSRLFVS